MWQAAARGRPRARRHPRVADTSRQGRFHNTRYRWLAEEVGLDVDQADRNGWAATTVPETTAACYAPEIDTIAAALVAYRTPESRPGGDGRFSGNNGQAAVCGCGRRIRAAPATLAGGPILCGLCGARFQPG